MLIIDMPMPKNCCECDLRQDNFDRGEQYCPFTGVECLSIGRQAKCPIKGELPDEHGDLIDRDVLYMAVKSHDTSDAAIARNHNKVTSLQNISTMKKGYIAEKHICLDDIIRAKAVIAAERKDNGTTAD